MLELAGRAAREDRSLSTIPHTVWCYNQWPSTAGGHARGRDAYLEGGNLIRQALDQDLVDALIVTIVPVLLGSGSARGFDSAAHHWRRASRFDVQPQGPTKGLASTHGAHEDRVARVVEHDPEPV